MDREVFLFGPRDGGGLAFGLRPGQVVYLAAAVAAPLIVAATLPGTSPLFALAAGAGLAATARLRVGGAGVDEWLVARWRFMLRRRHYRAPLLPHAPDDDTTEVLLPAPFTGLALRAVPVDGGRIGVVVDRAAGRVSAVAALGGGEFALLDPDEATRRVAAWGQALAAAGRPGSPVVTVGCFDLTRPDDGAALRRTWTAGGGRGPAAANASYTALLDATTGTTVVHDTLLALTVTAPAGPRRRRGGQGGVAAALAVLLRELAAATAHLADAGLPVEGWLPARRLALLLRGGVDPAAEARLYDRPDGRAGASPSAAGAMATDESWAGFRSDSAWHRTFWIAEWPRLPVTAEFLTPLLLHTTCRRRVALLAVPVPAAVAARRLRADRTRHLVDAAARAKHGQLDSERHRAEADAAERREAELVAGHATFRFVGLVTVSATDADALDAACDELTHAAEASHLELRPLYGRQAEAFVWTLPLGRVPR